jgi:hypothetical protein
MGNGLDFDKSFEIIRRAATQRRFVNYKELADGSGADWKRVHYSIGKHLWALVEYAHRKGWPMLSAVVGTSRTLRPERWSRRQSRASSLLHVNSDFRSPMRKDSCASSSARSSNGLVEVNSTVEGARNDGDNRGGQDSACDSPARKSFVRLSFGQRTLGPIGH